MLDFGFYNMDCIEGMKQFPDKYFDLAIVDPPYGGGAKQGEDAKIVGGGVRIGSINAEADSAAGSTATTSTRPQKLRGGGTEIWDSRPRGRFGQRFDRYHIDSSADNICGDGREMECALPPTMPGGETPTSIAHWDVAPPKEYFDELARVSKDQVIWGGNYFDLPPTRCFLIWRKLSISENFTMSMCEYAWTSFNDNAKLFECAPQGKASEPRIHPTQKPVKLYSWILARYAKPGFKILDTHVGSASSLIACHRAGLQYVGFELDQIYYKLATERLQRETAQIGFFDLQ